MSLSFPLMMYYPAAGLTDLTLFFSRKKPREGVAGFSKSCGEASF